MDLMVNPVITGFRQDVDGTIKELKLGEEKQDAWANIAEQGASSKLDNNKTKTIDVSTYTEPVEVLPTSGKDGMKKATITLSNIPSPSGGSTLYCWENPSHYYVYTLTSTPTTSDKAVEGVYYPSDDNVICEAKEITAIGEGTITVNGGDYERYATGDISLT